MATPPARKNSFHSSAGRSSQKKVVQSATFAAPLPEWKFLSTAAVILVIAFLLRAFRIGAYELWLDESFSFHLATANDWLQSALIDNTPPLYYLLLRLWAHWFGSSEAALRMLSACVGTLFVGAAIWAGREIFTSRIGLWSGLAAAVAPIQIYYSQEARAYALLSLMLLLTYILLWRAVAKDTWRRWTIFSIAAVLTLYTHYFALVGLMTTAFLPFLWSQREWWPRFLTAILVSLVLFSPWPISGFLFASHPAVGIHWIQEIWQSTPPLLAIPRSLEVLGLGSQAGLLPLWMKQFSDIHFPPALRYFGLLMLFLLGVCVALNRGDENLDVPWLKQRKIWLALMLLFPLFVLWCFSFYRPVYAVGRYDVVAYPPYPILLGLALGKVQRWKGSRLLLACLIALLLAIPIGTKLYLYYQVPVERDAEPTAVALHAKVSTGDVVVITGLRALPVLYYLNRIGYCWQNGVCTDSAGKRRFYCRMFPRSTERTPAASDTARALHSPEDARIELQDYISKLRPQGSLWVAFASGSVSNGRLRVSRTDTLLVRELERLGFRGAPIDTAPMVFEFRQL